MIKIIQSSLIKVSDFQELYSFDRGNQLTYPIRYNQQNNEADDGGGKYSDYHKKI